jgi:hypothetical protein
MPIVKPFKYKIHFQIRRRIWYRAVNRLALLKNWKVVSNTTYLCNLNQSYKSSAAITAKNVSTWYAIDFWVLKKKVTGCRKNNSLFIPMYKKYRPASHIRELLLDERGRLCRYKTSETRGHVSHREVLALKSIPLKIVGLQPQSPYCSPIKTIQRSILCWDRSN